ncbi:MAG: signal peptidase I [Candidatus Paceibacterota bacterium]
MDGEQKKSGGINKQSVVEIIRFALITLIIVIPIRAYVAQPFIVNGESMVPTFQNGEYLIVDELSYHFREPKRGEVIVFRYPEDPAKFFIKRVIGLPGESVVIQDNQLSIIKGNQVITPDEPYVRHEAPYQNTKINLGADQYFVMGDNRDVSSDSRVWGPLTAKLIKGRAFLRLFPLSEMTVLPGQPNNY